MRCGGRNSARRGGSAAQYRKRGIPSVLLVGAAEHRAARRLRRSKIAELRVTLAALRQRPRFPAKTGHPRKSAQTAGFCCRKAHLGYLSDNYTSEKGCLSIPQTQNIPVRGFRGGVFRPRKRGRGGGGTPVSGVRTETNVNAQRRTCRTEVWKKCMHQTHPAARKSAFRIINTAHGA